MGLEGIQRDLRTEILINCLIIDVRMLKMLKIVPDVILNII